VRSFFPFLLASATRLKRDEIIALQVIVCA
jgi:hypothetical protein